MVSDGISLTIICQDPISQMYRPLIDEAADGGVLEKELGHCQKAVLPLFGVAILIMGLRVSLQP